MSFFSFSFQRLFEVGMGIGLGVEGKRGLRVEEGRLTEDVIAGTTQRSQSATQEK